MLQVEWTNLRVCPPCLDPRPPQMDPPDVYPEGIPFTDARPPQDNPDLWMDSSTLQSTGGGVVVVAGGNFALPNGQVPPVGAVSPQTIVETPLPDDVDSLTISDYAIRTGPVAPLGNTVDLTQDQSLRNGSIPNQPQVAQGDPT